MKKNFITLLSIFLLTSCAFNQAPKEATISAHGEAEITIAPDIVTFSFTVKHQEKEVKLAQQKMSEKAKKAISLLKEKGISEKEIKTTSYNTYPKYVYVAGECDKRGNCKPSKQILEGYEALESFLVRVRNLERVGEILSDIAQLEIAEVGGLSFEIDDLLKVKSQARNEAIIKAKNNAKSIADSLGVKLGKIYDFREEEEGSYSPVSDLAFTEKRMMSATVAAPVKAGEKKITAKVTIVYKIIQ